MHCANFSACTGCIADTTPRATPLASRSAARFVVFRSEKCIMATTTTPSGLALLRAPFLPNQISKLPKPKSKDAIKGHCNECGGWHGLPAVHLDYVGHAALTDRLLDADPLWAWEPLSADAAGLPLLDRDGGMWIKLTVCGVTRLGYGDAQGKMGADATKERIGDALRNAAMRFGAALDLWHKGDLHVHPEPDAAERRAAWIAERKADIASAKTIGALKKIMDEALVKVRENRDQAAEDELIAASAVKVAKAKPQTQEEAA